MHKFFILLCVVGVVMGKVLDLTHTPDLTKSEQRQLPRSVNLSFFVPAFSLFALASQFMPQMFPSLTTTTSSRNHQRNRREVPHWIDEFVNKTFCSLNGEKILTCCTEPKHLTEFEIELSNLGNKFGGMRGQLLGGVELVEALNCPNTNLTKETIKSLKILEKVDWSKLLTLEGSCVRRVQQAYLCGGVCGPTLQTLKPCQGLCLNILRGCFNTLSENLLSSWKHAINSVKTAIRLLVTYKCPGTPLDPLDNLTTQLNTFREPFNWIDGVCEFTTTTTNCFSGSVDQLGLPMATTYTKQISPWSTNPKYSNPELVSNRVYPGIESIKDELNGVVKTLDLYWPKLDAEQPQSDEAVYYDDDEDEYNGSGSGYYGNRFETDDEDLLESSGSSKILEDLPNNTKISITTQSSSIKLTPSILIIIIIILI